MLTQILDASFTDTEFKYKATKLFIVSMSQSTLYYDGQCSVCTKEIKLLGLLATENITFVDIHEAHKLTHLPDKNEMLKTLHYQDQNLHWYYGLDATVKAWGHTPVGFMFKPLRIWPLNQVADRLYVIWAQKRYCSKYNQCKVN